MRKRLTTEQKLKAFLDSLKQNAPNILQNLIILLIYNYTTTDLSKTPKEQKKRALALLKKYLLPKKPMILEELASIKKRLHQEDFDYNQLEELPNLLCTNESVFEALFLETGRTQGLKNLQQYLEKLATSENQENFSLIMQQRFHASIVTLEREYQQDIYTDYRSVCFTIILSLMIMIITLIIPPLIAELILGRNFMSILANMSSSSLSIIMPAGTICMSILAVAGIDYIRQTLEQNIELKEKAAQQRLYEVIDQLNLHRPEPRTQQRPAENRRLQTTSLAAPPSCATAALSLSANEATATERGAESSSPEETLLRQRNPTYRIRPACATPPPPPPEEKSRLIPKPKYISFIPGGPKYPVVYSEERIHDPTPDALVVYSAITKSKSGSGSAYRYIVIPKEIWDTLGIAAHIKLQMLSYIINGNFYKKEGNFWVCGNESKGTRLYIHDGKGSQGRKGTTLEDHKEALIAVAFGDFHVRQGYVNLRQLAASTSRLAENIFGPMKP